MIYNNDRDPNVTDWEAMVTDAATEPAYPLQFHEAKDPAQMFGISKKRESDLHEQMSLLAEECGFEMITVADEPESISMSIRCANAFAKSPAEIAYIFYITGQFVERQKAEQED